MPKRSTKLTAGTLREFARAGADLTLKHLRAEIVAIERTFPELTEGRRAVRQAVTAARKRTRTMSTAGRKAVSARMKRYWAERRKAHAKIK